MRCLMKMNVYAMLQVNSTSAVLWNKLKVLQPGTLI